MQSIFPLKYLFPNHGQIYKARLVEIAGLHTTPPPPPPPPPPLKINMP